MKKIENIVLFVGLILGGISFLWNLVICVTQNPDILTQSGFSPILYRWILMLVILALPLTIMCRNLMSKTSKILSIISFVVYVIVLFIVLYSLFTPAIPQHTIMNKIGLINTYLTLILSYLKNGGIIALPSYILLLVGSLLSFFKSIKER